MKTLSIGLTGGIGCGKTLIAKVFSHLNVPIFNADTEAKLLYQDDEIKEQLKTMFSEDIFIGDVLNTKKLSQIVFSNKEKLQQLSDFIHPLVQKRYQSFLNKNTVLNVPYVIMESAIIFESKWEKYFDKLICVNTPQNLVIQRAMQRDNASKQEIMQRINNQLSVEYKISNSNYVILNDDLALVLPQVINIDKQLKTLSNIK